MKCERGINRIILFASESTTTMNHPITSFCVRDYNIIMRTALHVTKVSQPESSGNVAASVMAWFVVAADCV